MKLKPLFQIITAFVLIFLSSCTKNENVSNVDSTIDSKEMVFKSVTEKEYQEATPFTKRLIDKIDASANALNIIEKIVQFNTKQHSLLVMMKIKFLITP